MNALKETILETLPSSLAFLSPVVRDDLIRVGNDHDGGYVVPAQAVKQSDVLISFGLNADWSFEKHFKCLNAKTEIHAYDHTVGERRFSRDYVWDVAKWLLLRATLAEVRRRRRILRSYRNFFPRQATHFEEAIHPRNTTPRHATIDKVFSRTESQRIFMKIDIEGAEYSIIDDILRYAPRVLAMTIEFHETQALRDSFCGAIKRRECPKFCVRGIA